MGGTESIRENLKKFKKKIQKDMPIKKMILFGSRARGKKGMNVDVDLIIVSPEFRRLDFFQGGSKMYDYWTLNLPVDFLCYTPEEFKKLSRMITIVREAVKKGVIIS